MSNIEINGTDVRIYTILSSDPIECDLSMLDAADSAFDQVCSDRVSSEGRWSRFVARFIMARQSDERHAEREAADEISVRTIFRNGQYWTYRTRTAAA